MENILPNNIAVAFANGDRITGENGIIYYNYFNLSLRWLCGYNNQLLSNKILDMSETLKKNPDEFITFSKEVNKILIDNAGKNFKFSIFQSEDSFKFINNFYSKKNKFPVYLSNLSGIIKDKEYRSFLELISLEKDSKKTDKTVEGWSITQIKNFFKHYNKQISMFILSPILLKEGLILSKETVSLLELYCHRYNIPILWDESCCCFYRTGTFFFLNQYTVNPDFIIIDTDIHQKKTIHLIIVNKRVKRKIRKLINQPPKKNQVVNIILLKSIFNFISQYKIKNYVNDTSHRLKHKLLALSSNTQNRYKVQSAGLITMISLPNEIIAQKLNRELKNKNVLFYFNNCQTIILIPQLIISNHLVDLFIQYLNDFFKEKK